MTEEVDFDRWYPEVPLAMGTYQLVGLYNTNERLSVPASVRGSSRSIASPGRRKFAFLRYEIFD